METAISRKEREKFIGFLSKSYIADIDNRISELKNQKANIRETIIEEFGYQIIEAQDGEDAVRKFRENKDAIQLLIMDVIMPKKNGKEAYEEVKAIKPDVKILFLSGYPNDIIHEKGILDESLNFLPKPSSPVTLLSKIREVLDR